MNTTALGARSAGEQLRSRLVGLGAGLMLVLVACIARLERSELASGALDRSLFGVVFGWALPLTAFLIVSDICSQRRLAFGFDRLARFGHSRRWLVAGSLGVAGVLTALLSVLYVWVALGFAASWQSPQLLGDGLTSSWIAALGGISYVAWFAFWSSVGRNGGGRFIGLILDWGVGLGSTFGASLVPRGHLRNLLGGLPPIGLGQGSSSLLLLGLSAVCLALALWRVDP